MTANATKPKCGCDIRPDAKPPVHTVCAWHIGLHRDGKLIVFTKPIEAPYLGKRKPK